METDEVCTSNLDPSVPATPDVHFNEAHIAAAKTVLEREIGADNVQCAFLSGSLAVGLGHGLSDVDVYFAPSSTDDARDRSFRQDELMVQLNPLSRDDVSAMATICAGFTDAPGARRQSTLSDKELQKSVRYAVGRTLVQARDLLPDPDTAHLALRRTLMTRGAYELSSFAEDALGALQFGDALTALQASLIALEFALESALAGVGDLYLGRKFHLRRAARSAALSSVLGDYLAVCQHPADLGDFRAAADLIVRRLLLCNHLVGSALLHGWAEPAEQLPALTDNRDGGGPVRSPWVTPARFAESWAMVGPDTGFRTTAEMTRVWLALDGRPLDAVCRSLLENEALAGLTTELLDGAVKQLVEKEVAVTSSEELVIGKR